MLRSVFVLILLFYSSCVISQPLIFENDSTLLKELRFNNYEWKIGYAMTCINGRKNESPKYDKFVCNVGFDDFNKIEIIQNEKYIIYLDDDRIIEKKENYYHQNDSLPVNSYIIYLTNNEVWIINLTLKKIYDSLNNININNIVDSTNVKYKVVGVEDNLDIVEKILDSNKR